MTGPEPAELIAADASTARTDAMDIGLEGAAAMVTSRDTLDKVAEA